MFTFWFNLNLSSKDIKEDRLRLNQKVNTNISLCMAIMLDNPYIHTTTILCDTALYQLFTIDNLHDIVRVQASLLS